MVVELGVEVGAQGIESTTRERFVDVLGSALMHTGGYWYCFRSRLCAGAAATI